MKEVASISWRSCGKNDEDFKKQGQGCGMESGLQERLDQLWDIGTSDGIEVIRTVGIVFYLWPARKKTMLSISTSRTPARDR